MTDKIKDGFAVLFLLKAANPADFAHIRGFCYLRLISHAVQRRKTNVSSITHRAHAQRLAAPNAVSGGFAAAFHFAKRQNEAACAHKYALSLQRRRLPKCGISQTD